MAVSHGKSEPSSDALEPAGSKATDDVDPLAVETEVALELIPPSAVAVAEPFERPPAESDAPVATPPKSPATAAPPLELPRAAASTDERRSVCRNTVRPDERVPEAPLSRSDADALALVAAAGAAPAAGGCGAAAGAGSCGAAGGAEAGGSGTSPALAV